MLYRRQERIPADLGTAVNVVAMVFGNLGADSGTGVAFTRDPATGARGVYGDYLANAQGEDVVAGIRNTVPLQELERLDKAARTTSCCGIMATLEGHYRDLCDIEFTIERGKLWMLQTRVGKRTAAAAFVIAAQLVDEGVIDLDEALRRVTGAQLAQLMFPRFDLRRRARRRSPRASPPRPAPPSARSSSTRARAAELAATGEPVILVRRETNPDDLPGMIAAQGILTTRGGKTSHAAVVARGMGKTCVCGADALEVDVPARRFTVGRADRQRGRRHLHRRHHRQGLPRRGAGAPVAGGAVLRGHRRRRTPTPLVAAVHRLLAHADQARAGCGVRTNADTGEDAARARRFGARASACAAPSTCSSATGARWSSG